MIRRASSRTAGLFSGIVLLSWLLSSIEPFPRHLVLIGIFSAGTLLLIEAALLPVSRREWPLLLGASLILTSVGFVSPLRYTNPSPPAGPGTVRFSDPVEAALIKYLSASQVPGLQNPNPPAQTGVSVWVIVALIAVTIGLGAAIWFLSEKKPEATPLAVASATLTAVAAFVDKLVSAFKVGSLATLHWWAVVMALALLGSGVLLILWGGRLLFWLPSKGSNSVAQGESSKSFGPSAPSESVDVGAPLGAALMVFGLSAALLALVPPLLFHSESVNKPIDVGSQPPPKGPIGASKIDVYRLDGVDGLGDGLNPQDSNIPPEKIQPVVDGLKDKAQSGDILLLLGSADCVPPKPKSRGGLLDSNEDIANRRAHWVENALDHQAVKDGINIETHALPEHERCGPTANVRAVYPFLIHGETN